jgi:hypothetical protein
MGFLYDMYGKRNPEFIKGVLVGLFLYAWWKDGIQYVGTCGTTLREAMNDVIKDLAELPKNYDIDQIIKNGYL